MTPAQYAYILAGCFCILIGLLALVMFVGRDTDTTPDVGLSILDRGGQDDATEDEILAGLEALRETPVALDLAEPPGSVHIARSPLLLGQRIPTPAGTLVVPPWRQPLTVQLAVTQAAIGETTGVFARIVTDLTGEPPATFGPREADLRFCEVT